MEYILALTCNRFVGLTQEGKITEMSDYTADNQTGTQETNADTI